MAIRPSECAGATFTGRLSRRLESPSTDYTWVHTTRDSGAPTIVLDNVTKRYGERIAVDNLTFTIDPGVVTGFLGPNGAGKSTTMRMILGLDRPTSGTITVDGRPFADAKAPLSEVGALLDPKAIWPGRSAYHHLLSFAVANGISRQRVKEVLELVGLSSVAKHRAGGFSLGMGQRLGIATALLDDPPHHHCR